MKLLEAIAVLQRELDAHGDRDLIAIDNHSVGPYDGYGGGIIGPVTEVAFDPNLGAVTIG